MTALSDEQIEMALQAIQRGLISSDPEGRGDNLAILLCERFEAHPDCPEDGELDDCGRWKQWAVDRQDVAFRLLSRAALDALLSHGWGPVADAERAGREAAARVAEMDCDWVGFGKAGLEQWDGGPDVVRDYRLGIRAGRAIAAAIRQGAPA